jgi:predicted outer membrane repeat protein
MIIIPRIFSIWALAAAFFGLLLVIPMQAQAARYHVLNSGTRVAGPSLQLDWSPENCYANLAAAAVVAAAADTILLSPETHLVESTVTLPSYLGVGNTVGATIRCSSNAQMVIPSSHTSFMAKDLTITSDGADSDLAAFLLSGGFDPSSRFVFERCVFSGNQGSDAASRGGSCIYAQDSGNGAILDIANCTFTENTCRGKGGALFIKNSYEVRIRDSFFGNNDSRNRLNVAGRGGAIALQSPLAPTKLYLTRVSFEGNRSWGPGGAIFIDDASLSMVDCQLNNSESDMEFFSEWMAGAGILMRRNAETHLEDIFLTVENCSFDGSKGHIDTNPWAGDGGAILVKGIDDRYVDVNVTDSSFTNNYNAQGAGLYIGRFATGNVTRCIFRNNTAYLQGGATFKGGAFEANLGETAVYSYCEFSGNRAGLDINDEPATVLGRGGVFSNRLNTRAEFYNCTFYNNTVHGAMSDGDAIMLPAEGGIFDSDLQRCVFVNNVFYGETGNSVQVSADAGSISQVSHCAFEAGQVETGGIADENSVILTGSPFRGVADLLPGASSPLLDSALDTGQAMDLAGHPVPNGSGPDIGAYEAFNWSPVPHYPTDKSLLTAYPNPFNPRTVLEFETRASGLVTLEVIDLAGRKIKTLVQGPREAGLHRVVWQGDNDQGQAMASGVYLARMRTDGISTTSKLTLAR